eukprot:jgi/Chlat1/9173/Chrsp97S08448
MLRKFLDAVSLRAIRRRLVSRNLQKDIDTHRLYLLTGYHALNQQGAVAAPKAAAEALSAEARSLTSEEQEHRVQANVHTQVLQVLRALRHIDGGAAASAPVSGLLFAAGAERISPSPADISAALKKDIGYSVRLQPSTIVHAEAGNGLFIDGEALPGAVVGVYPGVVYTPSQVRKIPGFPKFDDGNPYLMSRYDAHVLDGKPFSKGTCISVAEAVLSKEAREKASRTTNEVKQQEDAIPLSELTGCNPLMLAHYANHPPHGTEPNVMACTYNFSVMNNDRELTLRRYLPNIKYDELVAREVTLESSKDVSCLVLVSTLALRDEELFLNYRLNPKSERPAWYHPVCEEEDRRRWA